VAGLLMEGDRVVGIDTPDGPVHADTVISAVGPWTGQIAAWANLSIPLVGDEGRYHMADPGDHTE